MASSKKKKPRVTLWQPGDRCNKCHSTLEAFKWVTHKNGSHHIRQECGLCGKFQRFVAQDDTALMYVQDPPELTSPIQPTFWD